MKVVSRRKLLQLLGDRPFVTPSEFASIRQQALIETKKSTTKPEQALFLLGKSAFFPKERSPDC